MRQVWVDVESGTWGYEDSDDPAIYVVTLPDHVLHEIDELRNIEDMTDNERISYARSFGVPLRMMGCSPKNSVL
jgi:hypothetical protein